MNICFTPTGWEDYQYWIAEDRKMERKIVMLIRDIAREPFKGIGKPEALRNEFQGWWSRRIDGEHRLVYRLSNETIWINQCRYHYKK